MNHFLLACSGHTHYHLPSLPSIVLCLIFVIYFFSRPFCFFSLLLPAEWLSIIHRRRRAPFAASSQWRRRQRMAQQRIFLLFFLFLSIFYDLTAQAYQFLIAAKFGASVFAFAASRVPLFWLVFCCFQVFLIAYVFSSFLIS